VLKAVAAHADRRRGVGAGRPSTAVHLPTSHRLVGRLGCRAERTADVGGIELQAC
jgi:hypothetical protein